MSRNVQGVQGLMRQLDRAVQAARSLEGEVATIQFDPGVETSINSAIHQIERAIDLKLAGYAGNPLVAQMGSRLKSLYARRVREAAQAAASSPTPSA